MMSKILPIIMIAISATLWGVIAIFVRNLANAGFTPMEIVTLRVIIASIMLGLIGAVKYRKEMKIEISDIRLFIGTGICSIVLFNWCYFTSIRQMNLSIAVILLYTAPAFVTVLSFLFLKEKMNTKKIISVAGTILGCVLIAGFNVKDSASISIEGILTGLGAGFGYALYSIFGKFALKKYHTFTVTFYTFLIAAITLLPLTGIWYKGSLLLNTDILFYGLGLGIFPTVIAYLLYTKGLEKIDSSRASIIATVEPLVATLLSVFLYNESFGVIQFLGSVLILVSILQVNLGPFKRISEKASISLD
jgi:drug/metabolite transporter, DME family